MLGTTIAIFQDGLNFLLFFRYIIIDLNHFDGSDQNDFSLLSFADHNPDPQYNPDP